MICPICTLWFCTDGKCRKPLDAKDRYAKHIATHDRTAYYRKYYEANREKKIAASLARYYAKRGQANDPAVTQRG